MKSLEDSRLRIPRNWRLSVVAILVCNVLTACETLTGPDRYEIPANTSDFRTRLYTGASIGNSRLNPNTTGTVFTVDSSSDMSTQLRLGYDVHNMLAVELDTSVLGASDLRQAGTDVKYSSAAISALIYGLSGNQLRSRREGLSAYGRFGFGTLKKSSAVLVLEESGTVPILGLGAEYGFSNGLGVRAEITRFDSDASHIGFGAIYRFGISPAGIGRMIAEAAEPALSAAHTTVPKDGRVLSGPARDRYESSTPEPQLGAANAARRSQQAAADYARGQQNVTHYNQTVADRWRPAMRAGDGDSDGVMDNVDNCPDTTTHVTVDRFGCGLFDAVLNDVTFKSGSRWLSPRARGQLDRVADTLLAFPESRVQVRAHTDSLGPADMNLGLSSRRAEVVVQYLQSRGVHELQMQAVGIGEAQPLDSNSSIDGRGRNRRVDIVTLPDQDAGQLLLAQGRGTARVVGTHNAAQRQADDQYTALADQWNSAPPLKASSASQKSVGDVEPGLLAAKPVAKSAAVSRKAKVNAAAQATQSAIASLPLPVPLPVPGFAPGFPISGVIEGLSFAQGSTMLDANAIEALEPLLQALKKNPDVDVAVMAHTDDRGEPEDNMALAKARAESVVSYLATQGIEPGRARAEGYGELLPLVQNVSDKDRARNRRIEIRILP